MPNFAGSKTQRVDIYVCMASRPAYTPARLAAWTAPQNYVLLFSQHLPARQLRQTFCSIQHVLFRRHPANTFQARFLTEHYTLRPPLPTSRRQPDSKLPPPHLFIPAPQSSASQRPPFRLDRPMHSLSYSFFIFFLSFFIPLHTKKETGKADFLFFSCNHKSSPNSTQASPSQSLSLLFSLSSQYTLPHRPRSGHT